MRAIRSKIHNKRGNCASCELIIQIRQETIAKSDRVEVEALCKHLKEDRQEVEALIKHLKILKSPQYLEKRKNILRNHVILFLLCTSYLKQAEHINVQSKPY